MPLSCLAPVSRDTAGFGGAGSPLPVCQDAPGPSSATLSRSPEVSQTPFQGLEGLRAILGSERAVSDKGGSGGDVGAAVPSRPVQRQNKPKACPCPCPCPSCVRAHVHIHAHTPPTAGVAAAKPRGGHRAPPALGPRGLGSQPRAVSVPSRLSPGGPPGPPLAAGVGAMAFQLEERWRWQRVLGATSCRLSVLPVSQRWLRPGPGPPGCPIPDGWVTPRRWRHPHSPAGCTGGPRGDGGCSPGEPGCRGRIRPGRSRVEGLSGGCHLSPSPRVPRNLP